MTEATVSVPELVAGGPVRPCVADAVAKWNDALATSLLLLDEHDDLTTTEVSALFDIPLVATAIIYAMAITDDGEMEEHVGRFADVLAEQRRLLAETESAPGALVQ